MKIGNFFNKKAGNNTASTPAEKCKALHSALKSRLKWKWDDRFGTVLAEFDVNAKDKIRTILDQHFDLSWGMTSIETAPEVVLAATEHLGGVFGEQIFFSHVFEDGSLVYCAWWPWGNGKTISIRIAPFPNDEILAFQNLFGL